MLRDTQTGDTTERASRFALVPALAGAPSELDSGILTWVESDALAALVAEFGEAGERIPAGTIGQRLSWLDEFSERWDFRAGKERNLVADSEYSPGTVELVLAAAEALGLRGSVQPTTQLYDHVLILGGLVRACVARPLHAAHLIANGLVARELTALGGYRPLGGNELPLASTLGLAEHCDEFDVMDAGVRKAFSLGEPTSERGIHSETVGASWRVREYAGPAGIPVSVIAAPSSEPGVRRANTPDTYEWFASEIAHLSDGQSLLIITTAIYVPFQHANALRMFALPHNVLVETVGVEPGTLDERLAQTFMPHQYLQEVRSTIRAFRDLHGALTTENHGEDTTVPIT